MPDASPDLCADLPDGTACGDPRDTDCDHPDVCMNGACVPVLEPAGTACGDTTDSECTNPDTCDGAGQCVANNAMDGVACNDCTAGAGSCSVCSDGVCTSDCSGAAELTTTYASEGGLDGVMFDLRARPGQDVNIQTFDVNLDPGTYDIELWYRTNSYQGFEETPAGWIMIGTATGVTSEAADAPTAVPFTLDIFIPAGETYGFYVTTTGDDAVNYSAGTSEGEVYTSDDNIEVLEGVGKQWPFSGTLGPRVFNGTIHYQTCP